MTDKELERLSNLVTDLTKDGQSRLLELILWFKTQEENDLSRYSPTGDPNYHIAEHKLHIQFLKGMHKRVKGIIEDSENT